MQVEVKIRRVIAAPAAWAVFLGNAEKTFVIHVGQGVGMALSMALEGVRKIRPLSHDLILNVLAGLGARVERVLINELRGDTFYARLLIREESERGTRIAEVDARPSDCLVLAAQAGAPIYVEDAVWDRVEDVGDIVEEGEGTDDAGNA